MVAKVSVIELSNIIEPVWLIKVIFTVLLVKFLKFEHFNYGFESRNVWRNILFFCKLNGSRKNIENYLWYKVIMKRL